MEYGTADDVIKNPQHPYTKALISNCASIDPEEKVQNIAIEGEPPTPLNPGPGCYFEPRCYCACETCRQSYPEKIVMENGHWATCSRINNKIKRGGKNMRKKIACLLAAALCVTAALGGCSGSGKGSGGDASSSDGSGGTFMSVRQGTRCRLTRMSREMTMVSDRSEYVPEAVCAGFQ